MAIIAFQRFFDESAQEVKIIRKLQNLSSI